MSPTPTVEPGAKRLLILDCALSSPTAGRILSTTLSTPSSTPHALLSNIPTLPDGITSDPSTGNIYVTHMGSSLSSNSGFIMRYNADGSNPRIVIPAGSEGVWTPKQIAFAQHAEGGKYVYWCDREGMKVMRACVDALPAVPEVLLSTGSPSSSASETDKLNWCVGVAVDVNRGMVYWGQKGGSKACGGRIFRADVDAVRDTEEVLFEMLPEPIDLHLDAHGEVLYWTDRGDPPRGNTLNRAFVGGEKGEVEILARRFHEAIGLAVDEEEGKAYVSDLAGGVYEVDLKTREKRVLFQELGDLTGVALV